MTRSTRRLAVLSALALAFGPACSEEKKPVVQKPKEVDPEVVAARAEAQTVYEQTCSPCHGVSGAGNGTKSDSLGIDPRNFQDPGWQASVKDAYIEEIIVKGGAAVGKSEIMPAHPDLAGKPRTVTALREYIRRFPQQ